jgi:hypothetical protein
MPDQLEIVKAVRARFPTPLGARHAEFLLTIAGALGGGAGLLRKSGGTVIALPDGTTVAQDIIAYPTGRIYDVLRDGEGAAEPTWGEANGSPVDPSRYYAVSGTPEPPDPPHPPDPPDDTLAKQVAALIAEVASLRSELQNVKFVADTAQSMADEARLKAEEALEKVSTSSVRLGDPVYVNGRMSLNDLFSKTTVTWIGKIGNPPEK